MLTSKTTSLLMTILHMEMNIKSIRLMEGLILVVILNTLATEEDLTVILAMEM